jgi:hypothetical protein
MESIKGGTNGRMRDVTILDRRWKWQYVTAFGEYNLSDYGQDHFKYYLSIGMRKNNRELVKLLLELLGESRVDVTNITKKLEQAVHFDGKSAAGFLDSLLETCGARINLRWDNSVSIDTLNAGKRPPNDDRVMDYTLTRTPPMIPEKLLIEPERTTFTNDFYLEPVGYEIDKDTGNVLTETLKRIDDLSWKPAKGWDPPLFHNVDKKWRNHARQFIYKIFRLRRPSQDFSMQTHQLVVPGLSQDAKQEAWNKQDDFQLKYFTGFAGAAGVADEDWARLDFHDTKVVPIIYGYWALDVHGHFNNHPYDKAKTFDVKDFRTLTRTKLEKYYAVDGDAGIIYKGQFHFDPAKQVVRFDHPMFFWMRDENAGGNLANPSVSSPRIAIRLDHQLRRKSDYEILRQMYQIKNTGPFIASGVTKTIKAPFVQYHVSWIEDETTRESVFKDQCLAAAQGELASYRMTESATIPMKGFCFDMNTDGSIFSVTFERDSSGRCTTVVEWKTENPYLAPTYREKIESMTRRDIFDAVERQGRMASEKKLKAQKRSHQ